MRFGPISTGDVRMKRLEIVFAKRALRDLDRLEGRIAREAGNLPTAERYCDRIVQACLRIGDAPEGSPLRDDIRSGLRLRHFERRLIIAYRIESERVVIFRIIDGRRNYPRILSGGGE